MTARYYFKQSPAVENFKGPQQGRAQCQDRPAPVRPASGQWFYLSPPSPLTGQLRPARASGSFVRAYFGEDTSPFSGVRAGRTRRFRAAGFCPRGRRELPPAAASGPGAARRPAPLCAGRCPPCSRQGRVRRPGLRAPGQSGVRPALVLTEGPVVPALHLARGQLVHARPSERATVAESRKQRCALTPEQLAGGGHATSAAAKRKLAAGGPSSLTLRRHRARLPPCSPAPVTYYLCSVARKCFFLDRRHTVLD